METTTRSTHQAHITRPPADSQPPCTSATPREAPAHEAGPAPDPVAVRDRVLTAQAPSAPDPQGGGTDLEKVAKNAAANAVALGSCFGTMTALNNAVRATPGMPAPVKALTGLLPSAGVFPTPWVEDGMRAALGTTATLPTRPSLAHDAVAGAALFLFNRACARSTRLPRFPAASAAGMAATVLQATAASVLAGAASELTAQWMNDQDRRSGDPHPAPALIDNTRKATGRLLSQAPAASLQTGLAFAGKPLPPSLSLLPLGVVTGGWCFRRVLIPPQATPQPAGGDGPAPSAPARPPQRPLPFPVSSIPPA